MKKKILGMMVMSCSIAVSASSAYAETVFKNDPVIVTASRYESSVSKEGKSITVVSGDEIKKSGKENLSDVLETIPGIILTRSGADGGLTNVYIRGSKSGNVLILIDGVKINDPMGIGKVYDISGIRTENIDRIEVVKGAMSSMYGAEATGGVINIITKKGVKKNIVITGEGGSNYTFAESVTVSDATEKSSFSFYGSHYKTRGISSSIYENGYTIPDKDGYENFTASGKMTSGVTQNSSVNLTMNFIDTKLDIDDSDMDDPNRVSRSKLFTGKGEFLHSPFSWWNYKGGVSYMSYEKGSVDPKDAKDDMENDFFTFCGSNTNFELINNFNILNFSILTAGVELLTEKGSSETEYFGPSIFEEKSVMTKSFFLHDSISILERIFFNFGGRVDHHKFFGNHSTWDASSSIIIPVTETRLKASAGTGFRAPALFELYDGSYGNRDLKPEKSVVYDAGVYQEILDGKFSIDVTLFKQRYTDMIKFGTKKYENVDTKIRNRGVEAGAGLKPVDMLIVHYGYTYLRYDDDESRKQALRRPRHKHSADLTILPLKGLSINGSYLYVSKRNDAFFNETTWKSTDVILDPYHKVDVNVRYSLNEMLTFTAKCENLTDANYEEISGYSTRGRSFYGGAELIL